MKKFRIKTKEEFINEFGENFRWKVEATFAPEMNYLLGERIPSNIGVDIFKGSRINYDGWWISKDMITYDYEPRVGEIVVVKGSSGGNPVGTVTKIISTKEPCDSHFKYNDNCTERDIVLCEAIYIADNHEFYYAKVPVWHEREENLRPATDEEKKYYHKQKWLSKRVQNRHEKTYEKFL